MRLRRSNDLDGGELWIAPVIQDGEPMRVWLSLSACIPVRRSRLDAPAMNVALLSRVRQSIVCAPDQFCAAQWAFARNADRVLRDGARPEGFRCCIAGHVLLEAKVFTRRELLREGGFHTGGGVWSRAARAAALEDDQARTLFFPSQWDRPYKQQYYLCNRDEEASLAASYIAFFVDEYGPSRVQNTGTARGEPAPARSPTRRRAEVEGRFAGAERVPA